ncbi:COG3 protein [Coprinopsis cinerea okayama7|uniref:Conserved oligomeric Golgi complex subunit 3 n=1 Tax=Coprinopsis cinerea (strain Okayama-7 / 130 / ATCC MYA-4618 / FGSC 9003) TaxID=240176 RepID=A8N7R6_COPC7|nr:COG3 protein [Coprinopsis cinerea okayama7\|eukprot:XP_001830872.2 COG3 protein [Coprinopsis cinerea okayama7\
MSSTSNFRASPRRTAQNAPSSLLQPPSNAGYARPSPLKSQQPSAAPTLSVEEWEAKAPLGDLEIRSVNAIKQATDKVPMPLKFSAEENDDDPSTPATPTNRFASSSRPSTPQNPFQNRTGTHALHPRQPVHTTQQLYDWFALIDRSVAHSQEAHFRAHIATVAQHLETCDLLLSKVDEIEREVDVMLENWRSVEEGGKSLKDACERLLEEKDKLVELTDDIGSHLEYFQQLDIATRMLNHPGEQLIYQSDFLYMVEKVDICIEFLKSRRHYKEAEVYLLRFQQCMTRAMTLIKMNFVGSLRALSSDISRRLSEKDVSQTAQMHLLYTRFRSVAAKVAPLLGELERRARSYPDELSALLSECHSAYFSTRKALLLPKIMEEIRGLDPSRSELVELTRAGCSYLKQLCTDEFNLYREFFSTAEDQLYQYLETLCDLLYDDLRPRILHEPRLTALCEVCTVLQALMVLDAPISTSTSTSSTLFSDGASSSSQIDTSDSESDEDSSDEDADSDSELTVDLDTASLTAKRKSKGKLGHVGRRLHIRHLLQMVLQDAQTRLFFKAQALIQSDIKYYTPKKEDLAWPDVIVAANQPKSGTEIREKETVSRIFKANLTQQETWYPTVRKMVWILSQLHDFVKPAIFEDIAQEAALLCRQSLLAARDMIKARPPPSTPLDGHLFLVRHLLILKDVAKSLEGESTNGQQKDISVGAFPSTPVKSAGMRTPGVSGFGAAEPASSGGVTGTLTTMLNRTTAILPEGLFASLGVSRDESIRGAKHGIDHDLRRACEDVINASVAPICGPLDDWVLRVQTLSSGSATKPGTSLRTAQSPPTGARTANPQTAAAGAVDIATLSNPTHILALYTEFRSAIERDLRANVARIRLYLGDADGEGQHGQGGQGQATQSGYQSSGTASGSDGEQQRTSSSSSPSSSHQHGRTAKILIDHVRDRVEEAYQGFVEQLREVVATSGAGSSEEVQRVLKEVESGGQGGSVKDVVRMICLGDVTRL